MALHTVNYHPDFGVVPTTRFVARKMNEKTHVIEDYLPVFELDGNSVPSGDSLLLTPQQIAAGYRVSPVPPLYAVHVIAGGSGCGKTVYARDLMQIARDDSVLTDNTAPPIPMETLKREQATATAMSTFKDTTAKRPIYIVLSAKFNDTTLTFAREELRIPIVQIHVDPTLINPTERVTQCIARMKRTVTLKGADFLFPPHIRAGCYWQPGFIPDENTEDDSEWNGCYHKPPCDIHSSLPPERSNIISTARKAPTARDGNNSSSNDSDSDNEPMGRTDISEPSSTRATKPRNLGASTDNKLLPPYLREMKRRLNAIKGNKEFLNDKELARLEEKYEELKIEEEKLKNMGERINWREEAMLAKLGGLRKIELATLITRFVKNNPGMLPYLADPNTPISKGELLMWAQEQGIAEELEKMSAEIGERDECKKNKLKRAFNADKEFLKSKAEEREKKLKKLKKADEKEQQHDNSNNPLLQHDQPPPSHHQKSAHDKKIDKQLYKKKQMSTAEKALYIPHTRVLLLMDDLEFGDKVNKTGLFYLVKEFTQKGRADNYFIMLVAHNIRDQQLAGIKSEYSYVTTFPKFKIDDGIRRHLVGQGTSESSAKEVMRYMTQNLEEMPHATFIFFGQPYIVTGTNSFKPALPYQKESVDEKEEKNISSSDTIADVDK